MNALVVGLMVMSAPTCGLLSAALIIWNGAKLGRGMAFLFDSEPRVAWLLMQYIPIEFLALVVAAAASMRLSAEIAGLLFSTNTVAWRSPALAIAVAFVLLLAAAAIEARVSLEIAELS